MLPIDQAFPRHIPVGGKDQAPAGHRIFEDIHPAFRRVGLGDSLIPAALVDEFFVHCAKDARKSSFIRIAFWQSAEALTQYPSGKRLDRQIKGHFSQEQFLFEKRTDSCATSTAQPNFRVSREVWEGCQCEHAIAPRVGLAAEIRRLEEMARKNGTISTFYRLTTGRRPTGVKEAMNHDDPFKAYTRYKWTNRRNDPEQFN
jgi:hypothetical protein